MKALFQRKWSLFVFKGAFIASFAFPLFGFSQNLSCSEFENLRMAKRQKPTTSSPMTEWAAYQQRIYEAKKQVARNIFKSYIEDKLENNFFENCLQSSEEYEELQEILPSIFLEKSLRQLNQSRGSSILQFNLIMSDKLKNNNLIMFKLVGHYKAEAAPTELAGGFHRGQGSIFMNFTKIPPNEWLIILIHELTHSLDIQLSEAISEYSKNEKVIALAREKKPLQNVNDEETKDLYRWLRAGLDRGFLAEYRAWVVTFKIYQDGVNEGLWKPISWMENILSQKNPQEDIQSFTFRYLDPRFTNPNEWPFQTSPAKEALENLRTHLRKSTTPRPSLKNLEIIIK